MSSWDKYDWLLATVGSLIALIGIAFLLGKETFPQMVAATMLVLAAMFLFPPRQ